MRTPRRKGRIADLVGQYLSMFGLLNVYAAGKAALWDHEPWTLWVPLLGVAAAAFVVMVLLADSANRR